MSETSALVEAQALPLHDRARQHCRGTLAHRLRATPNAGDRAGGAPTTHTDYSQRTACLRWAAWPAERARKRQAEPSPRQQAQWRSRGKPPLRTALGAFDAAPLAPRRPGAVDRAMIGAGAAAVAAKDVVSAGVQAMGHAIRGSEGEPETDDAGSSGVAVPSRAERTAVIEGAAAAGAEREMVSASKSAHDHMAKAEAASAEAAVADSDEAQEACQAKADEEAKAASAKVAQAAGDASRAADHGGHAQAAAVTG